jgi:hypothetical protein
MPPVRPTDGVSSVACAQGLATTGLQQRLATDREEKDARKPVMYWGNVVTSPVFKISWKNKKSTARRPHEPHP